MGRETLDHTTLVDDDARPVHRAVVSPTAALIRVFTPRAGPGFEVYPIGQTGLTIGRNPPEENRAQIDDHKASRRHAEIRWVDALRGHILCDLRSTNGTFLNGTPVDRDILDKGDVVRTGNSLFVYCTSPPEPSLNPSGPLIGRSSSMLEVIQSLLQVAPTDLKVLLTGETGTGKELAAQLIHDASGRKGPFVPVNCGSFPASLIESELFGHVKGAFSGAERAKEGLIASAHGGTLFLDEIGEFPLDLQPRLLRVLQDQDVRPVGATSSSRVDVRVVAATNQPIIEMVERDAFRRDLFARLNEWPIELPPLRQRREDIGLLARHFLERRGTAELAERLEPDLFELLLLHDWPANVRELGAAIARLSVTLSGVAGGVGDTDRLSRQVFGASPPRIPPERTVPAPPDASELMRTLALYEGNVSGVARYYGKERQQIYRWMERFELSEG